MQIREAIILAGGLGTRLRETVPGLPKCMAPVKNRPFLSYVITYLKKQGIERFIFSLGYLSDTFTKYLAETVTQDSYQLVIEKEPLGTGGAIRLACGYAQDNNIAVLNGDSLFAVDLQEQGAFHAAHGADCTLALKYMQRFDRYGAVKLNADHTIASFQEKKFYAEGLINGGVYLLDKTAFLDKGLPEKFSFETDYLQAYYSGGKIYGQVQDAYFIDIGIPEDYKRAQTELINYYA